MIDKPIKIKFAKCRYCGADDLFWEIDKNINRWVLHENYGLPHACDKAMEHFKQQRQRELDAKKERYQKEKKRIEAIPDNSPCKNCVGGQLMGVYWSNSPSRRCFACDGNGKITTKVKARELYRIRKSLWPDMFKKRG